MLVSSSSRYSPGGVPAGVSVGSLHSTLSVVVIVVLQLLSVSPHSATEQLKFQVPTVQIAPLKVEPAIASDGVELRVAVHPHQLSSLQFTETAELTSTVWGLAGIILHFGALQLGSQASIVGYSPAGSISHLGTPLVILQAYFLQALGSAISHSLGPAHGTSLQA